MEKNNSPRILDSRSFRNGVIDGLTAHMRLFEANPYKIYVKPYSSKGIAGDLEKIAVDFSYALKSTNLKT